MFSKTCEYGIRATIYVAQQSALSKRVGVKDIAKAINSPKAFTGKIMQQLTKKGIVNSVKGPYGGFWISKELINTVTLSDLVALFDGGGAYKGCMLGLSNCSDIKPCPLHNETADIQQQLKKVLEQKSIADILYTDGEFSQFWFKK